MAAERALIAYGMKGNPIVVATDGAGIAWDVSEVSDNADHIGLCHYCDQKPGLYLYEGTSQRSYDRDGNCVGWEWTGTVRAVNPDEISALLAMKPPENPAIDDTP